MNTRHLWTKEQDELLKKLWGKINNSEIAMRIQISKKQVCHRAMYLGLPRLKDAPSQGGQHILINQTHDSNKMFLDAYSAWAKKNNIDLHPYKKKSSINLRQEQQL
jgi:hypothetical protein